MKYALIKQPAGLGDIFFLQKAVKELIEKGFTVIWPVQPHFLYLSEYIKYDGLTFYSLNSDFPFKNLYNVGFEPSIHQVGNDEVLYVPFLHAELSFRGVAGMKTKYPLIGASSDNWQEYFKFTRNHERELELRNKYNIGENEDFVFVNNLFASPPDMLRRPVYVQSDCKIVYNDGDPCHVFDFCWLFEHAKEIHTIESAFCYLVEVLNTSGKLFMYSRIVNGRPQHQNFDYVNHIYRKNWTKIQ
jgi:hypothetical protein